MSNNSKTTIDINLGGFATILTLIFITLKLTGHITWGWLWVFSPLWLCVSLIVSLLGLFLIGAAFANFISNRRKNPFK